VRFLVSIAIVLTCASCGAKRRASGSDKEKTFSVWFRTDASHFTQRVAVPVDSVWRFVPATFQFMRFPGAPSVYNDEYVYLTPSLKIEGRLYQGEANSLYINCGHTVGGVPIADTYRVTFALLMKLTPQSDRDTEVDIILDGTAQDMAERSESVHCTGTGRLEATIYRRLETFLASHND
jgi:hypothetical protein